ncbi:tetratricopeptide repeat protein [Bizionia arctica]|uniref:Tetratricopeptide repeat protein n=1 Tax=Bizionia arctica TaxID=1495645 RepID=A0A917LLP9_9FLAO|nr:tetratricopeptide repeat protein [Bizionia arctica]GGG42512.1 hypothetical protein GCM10010976_12560 [Bizionia arctica]
MNNQELLYLYFSNSLTPEQETLFQSLLATDVAFKAEFEYEKNLQKAIKSSETDRLKSKLQDVEQNLNKQDKSIFNYRNFAIAASIVLLMGWFGYNTFFSTNYNSLYDSNFSEYPNTVYPITRSDDSNSLEREAFVAYETKNYQIAIEKFDALTESDKQEYVNFYKAQAYLGLEDTNNAKALFIQILTEDTSFVAEANWYLALIAIKEKDKTQAIAYLENLVSNYNYNKNKAQELIDKLN